MVILIRKPEITIGFPPRTAEIKRGKILDRHGNVLALSRHSLSVYADPKYMRVDPL